LEYLWASASVASGQLWHSRPVAWHRRDHRLDHAAHFPADQRGSGRCLDIAGGSQTNGATRQIWDCDGGANHKGNRG
jgi:hypothetical protein